MKRGFNIKSFLRSRNFHEDEDVKIRLSGNRHLISQSFRPFQNSIFSNLSNRIAKNWGFRLNGGLNWTNTGYFWCLHWYKLNRFMVMGEKNLDFVSPRTFGSIIDISTYRLDIQRLAPSLSLIFLRYTNSICTRLISRARTGVFVHILFANIFK